MRMPFGKHQGERVDELPESYLAWVLDNVDTLQPTLRDEIERVLEIGWHASAVQVPTGDVIGRWYRELAREYHPDHGGSHAEMKVVNRANELLRELVA